MTEAVDALPDDPEPLKAMLIAERIRSERLVQIIKEMQRHRFGRRAESPPLAERARNRPKNPCSRSFAATSRISVRPRQRRRAISSSSLVLHPWTSARSRTDLALRPRAGFPLFDESPALRENLPPATPPSRISILDLLLSTDRRRSESRAWLRLGERIVRVRPDYAVAEIALATTATAPFTRDETARRRASRRHDRVASARRTRSRAAGRSAESGRARRSELDPGFRTSG